MTGFLRAAEDFLADSKNAQNRVATRFGLAYDAAYALAHAALRSHDLRPTQDKGHRFIVFQCLVHTANAPPEVWVTLSKAHNRRNASVY